MPADEQQIRNRLTVPFACVLFSAVVAAVAICGWLFHIDRLVTILPGLPAMAVTTALGFLLSSAALALQIPASRRTSQVPFALRRISAALVIIIGVATLGYYLFGVGAASLAGQLAVHASGPVNRTSPNTSVNFVLLGVALLLVDSAWKKRSRQQSSNASIGPEDLGEGRWPSQIIALVVLLNSGLALLGQSYGVTLLFGLSRAFGMSLPTALLFGVLSFGVLALHPQRGFVGVFLADDVAGQAARRLLPSVVAVPLVVGGIALLGFRAAPSFATYLLVVASIGLLVSLFWSTILTLRQEVNRGFDYVRQIYARDIALERQSVEIEKAAMIVQQRRFVREMLASVTEGKLCLCDSVADLPPRAAPASEAIELTAVTLRSLRMQVSAAAESLELEADRAHDIITASGEASMNAVRHGGGGTGRVHIHREKRMLQVWIQDFGGGIAEENLHRATLEKGWSGAGSFGHGFFLMLRTVDRTFLLTGAAGTTVVLEQDVSLPKPM